MITTETSGGRIEMRAFGRLTLEDLKSFEAQTQAIERADGKLDVLLDLRDLESTSLDALIEEWKFAHQHSRDFRRIAVVSDDSLIGWGACLSQLFVDGEIQIFDSEPLARLWLESETESIGEAPPSDALQ